MSSAKAKALPAFHALSGSDNTSFFSGTGKKSAYAKWSTRPELTTTLCHLMDKPETPSSEDTTVIKSFVISLYSMYCTLTDVNKARQQIFAQSSRTFEYLPSPKAALVEHIKRTTHQTGYVWGQSIIAKQVLPIPNLWGWANSETGRVPFWTAVPRAAKAINVLIAEVALKGVPITRTVLCAQLYANAEDTAMGSPILLLRLPQTNNIAVM